MQPPKQIMRLLRSVALVAICAVATFVVLAMMRGGPSYSELDALEPFRSVPQQQALPVPADLIASAWSRVYRGGIQDGGTTMVLEQWFEQWTGDRKLSLQV